MLRNDTTETPAPVFLYDTKIGKRWHDATTCTIESMRLQCIGKPKGGAMAVLVTGAALRAPETIVPIHEAIADLLERQAKLRGAASESIHDFGVAFRTQQIDAAS